MKKAEVIGALCSLHSHAIGSATAYQIATEVQRLDDRRFGPAFGGVLRALHALERDGIVVSTKSDDWIRGEGHIWTYRLVYEERLRRYIARTEEMVTDLRLGGDA